MPSAISSSVVSMVASPAPSVSGRSASWLSELAANQTSRTIIPETPAATAEAIDRGRARSPTLADPP